MIELKVIFFLLFPILSLATDNELNKPGSKDRYYLQPKLLSAINKQINEELYASYVYGAMAAYFSRIDVGDECIAKFFQENAAEERGHAQKFIDYAILRGGRLEAYNFKMPSKYTWNSSLDALKDALSLEQYVYNKLFQLAELATSYSDVHLNDYVTDEFYDEQIKSIATLTRYITKLKKMNTPIGNYMFERELCGCCAG